MYPSNGLYVSFFVGLLNDAKGYDSETSSRLCLLTRVASPDRGNRKTRRLRSKRLESERVRLQIKFLFLRVELDPS